MIIIVNQYGSDVIEPLIWQNRIRLDSRCRAVESPINLRTRYRSRVQSMVTMTALRRGFQRTMRRLGPFLVALSALLVMGFGLHAALDWHHHGRVGAGFFHLHVHVGHHHHGGFDHHHHESPDPESPDPGSPSDDRRECGTLTMAFGVAPVPAISTAAIPTVARDERADFRAPIPTDRDLAGRPWSPRGPPSFG